MWQRGILKGPWEEEKEEQLKHCSSEKEKCNWTYLILSSKLLNYCTSSVTGIRSDWGTLRLTLTWKWLVATRHENTQWWRLPIKSSDHRNPVYGNEHGVRWRRHGKSPWPLQPQKSGLQWMRKRCVPWLHPARTLPDFVTVGSHLSRRRPLIFAWVWQAVWVTTQV